VENPLARWRSVCCQDHLPRRDDHGDAVIPLLDVTASSGPGASRGDVGPWRMHTALPLVENAYPCGLLEVVHQTMKSHLPEFPNSRCPGQPPVTTRMRSSSPRRGCSRSSPRSCSRWRSIAAPSPAERDQLYFGARLRRMAHRLLDLLFSFNFRVRGELGPPTIPAADSSSSPAR